MSFRKLKKTLTTVALVFCAAVVLLGVFWFKEIFFGAKEEDECMRPLAEKVLLTSGDKNGLRVDEKGWDLEMSREGIIKIEAGKIFPLQKGNVEIILKKRGNENCSFTSEISVVNFISPAGAGVGRM